MSQPLLEVHFHLADGSTTSFAQSDAGAVRGILANVQHGRIFAQPTLVIAGTSSVTALPGNLITRLDLVLSEADIPNWLLQLEPNGIIKTEISLEQFQLSQESHADPASTTLWEDIRLAGGSRCLMEVHRPVQSSLTVQRQHLQNVFSLPSLSCRRLGGGVSLLNPAQIVSHTYYPKMEPPASAWVAESIQYP
ncbi:hypothetical protein IAD21_04543 [Abditibacteriota bacterium]|nr:hypothetical protein IAD21_04543 [Abditibacteriota bacterium]